MRTLIAILFFVCSLGVSAQKIVEFRGENRSGCYNEKNLLKEWPEKNGPKVILRIEGIGKGYSQCILAESKIFVTGIKDDTTDVLSAFDLDGKLLWDVPYGRSWTGSYIDSRSTPTYQDGRLYVASGTGQLNCIDANSGNILWQVDAVEKYGGSIHTHGDAEAPLIVSDLVVFTTGGEKYTMVAFNKISGETVWKARSLGGNKSYASPTLIEQNGHQIILTQTAENLIGIDAKTGELLWNHNLMQYHLHSQGKGGNTNPPLYQNGEIFVSSGYEHPALLFSLSPDGSSVSLKWKNDILDTHHGGDVLVDGNIYGATWTNNSNGKWACINWNTGETKWEQEWENKGSIIAADNMLYLYEEKRGNIALVAPSTDSLKIVSSFKFDEGAGPHWAHPAVYDGMLFVRHGDVLKVFDIKADN
ncbi:PQQ-binding-like beta-propeller repeat protein [Maribellus sp. YY47]|uniref:PQQ-binding-like beta-propeller repeat protein n=1 Tax=Maribellus sp. YY47 TaxID=2929486 RepID=UPI0020018478|nr:PQQ-binding-like beta-propeller repeat protein [Maribellus sp. YY47]MCK3682972.1 PQQ-like beta-propeller repeat protein [Maribellus sp. YY47]